MPVKREDALCLMIQSDSPAADDRIAVEADAVLGDSTYLPIV